MNFFIVGTSRCGTTLLRSLLHAHPAIDVLNESHWLPRMFECFGTQFIDPGQLMDIAEKTSWDTGRSLFDVNAEYAEHVTLRDAGKLTEALGKGLAAVESVSVAGFHDEFARLLFPGASILGDKTPDYGFFMSQLQELWPDARFVHIVRDGLPTARSMSRHSGCQLMVSAGYDNWCFLSYDRNYERYQATECPLDDYVSSWRRRLSRIRNEAERLSEGSYIEVRYEDILQSPARVLEELAKVLGVTPNEDWLRWCAGQVQPQKAIYALEPGEVAGLSLPNLVAIGFPEIWEVNFGRTGYELPDRVKSGEENKSHEEAALTALACVCAAYKAGDVELQSKAVERLVECLNELGLHAIAKQWKQNIGCENASVITESK